MKSSRLSSPPYQDQFPVGELQTVAHLGSHKPGTEKINFEQRFFLFSNSGGSEIQSIEYRIQPSSGKLVSIPFKFRIWPSGITDHLTFIFVSAYIFLSLAAIVYFLSFLKCHCVFVFTCRGFPSTWLRSRGPSHLW